MKATFFALAASATLASAQVTVNSTTGAFTCTKPNSAFCSGNSLGTDIIIRCNALGQGQPGRCGDNLAGEFPQGVGGALCFQSSPTAGDAACEKNVSLTLFPFASPCRTCS